MTGPGSPPEWLLEAYALGKKGQPARMTKSMLVHILSDRKPSDWVKWWRCGFVDGERERGGVLIPRFSDCDRWDASLEEAGDE